MYHIVCWESSQSTSPTLGEVPQETLTLLLQGSEKSRLFSRRNLPSCSCCSQALHFASAFWESTSGGLVHTQHDTPAQASQDKLLTAAHHLQVGQTKAVGSTEAGGVVLE